MRLKLQSTVPHPGALARRRRATDTGKLPITSRSSKHAARLARSASRPSVEQLSHGEIAMSRQLANFSRVADQPPKECQQHGCSHSSVVGHREGIAASRFRNLHGCHYVHVTVVAVSYKFSTLSRFDSPLDCHQPACPSSEPGPVASRPLPSGRPTGTGLSAPEFATRPRLHRRETPPDRPCRRAAVLY